MAYPVTFDIPPQATYDKGQVALRIIIFFVLAVFGIFGIVFGGAYWVFPLAAAVLISQKGAEAYLASASSGPTLWLKYIMGIYSYFALATDKLPFDNPDEVDLKVQTTGTPSVGSALLRLIMGIPHAIVLWLLGIVFFFVWLFAAISVLVSETYPEWAADFIRGYLAWNARLLAYMASLVDEYPPFSLEVGEGGSGAAQPASPPPSPPPASPPPGPQA
jgi:Domain of unknown function (DUF4389)